MVNNAAKSPEKNISSLPSQIITPMANIGGRSWTIFLASPGYRGNRLTHGYIF